MLKPVHLWLNIVEACLRCFKMIKLKMLKDFSRWFEIVIPLKQTFFKMVETSIFRTGPRWQSTPILSSPPRSASAPCGVPVLGPRTCGWLRRPDLWENKKNLRAYGCIRYIYCSSMASWVHHGSSMNGCVQDMFSHCLSMVSWVYPHLLGILNISMVNHAYTGIYWFCG